MRHTSPENLWILDHNTNDNSTDASKIPKGINYYKLYGEKSYSPFFFLNRRVELHQQRLFRYGYKCVLFTEVDEIIVADPDVYPGGLREYFTKFYENSTLLTVRTSNRIMVHVSEPPVNKADDSLIEPILNWSKPILSQRSYWLQNRFFNKPLLSKQHLQWTPGFHDSYDAVAINPDPNLVLIHLHGVDAIYCAIREEGKWNNALTRGKASESGLGMKARTKYAKLYNEIRDEENVCGEARSKNTMNGIVKTGYGSKVRKIEDKWMQVII